MEALFTFGINQSEQSVFTFVHIVCIQITDWSFFPSAIFNIILCSHLMAISITLQKVKKKNIE